MKLVKQSVEIWKQPEGEIGIYKQIERTARLCYKSCDKITEDSYKKFIGMLKSNGHNSPLEHGTIYLITKYRDIIEKYKSNPFSKVIIQNQNAYITSNFRVIKEHGWGDDLQYLCEPTEHHEKRVSVHITTSRSVSHELVRHRVFSFCQESQRYCNYSKDKFGNELTFIIPNWVDIPTGQYHYWDGDWCDINEMKLQIPDNDEAISSFLWTLNNAEMNYTLLLNKGWKPQQAREILPNSTKTELVMTGFESQWEQFFKLRCSPAAHPMMQELANKIKNVVE